MLQVRRLGLQYSGSGASCRTVAHAVRRGPSAIAAPLPHETASRSSLSQRPPPPQSWLAGIELLKDGGFLMATLDPDAERPTAFHLHRLGR
jgi:hypothetical protein